MVADLKLRFTRLTGLARERVGCFDEQVQGHEEYRRAYIACLDWLANNRHRLQRLSDYSGDKKILQDRLQQLKVWNIVNELMKFFVFTYAIQGNALYVQYGRKSLENTYMLVFGNLLILNAFFISICLITTINCVFFSLYLSNCNIKHL